MTSSIAASEPMLKLTSTQAEFVIQPVVRIAGVLATRSRVAVWPLLSTRLRVQSVLAEARRLFSKKTPLAPPEILPVLGPLASTKQFSVQMFPHGPPASHTLVPQSRPAYSPSSAPSARSLKRT